METREYFEKVMPNFNQNRKGRNLRKCCNDEGIGYKWLSECKKQHTSTMTRKQEEEQPSLIPIQVVDERFSEQGKAEMLRMWGVRKLALVSSAGDELEISSNNIAVVAELLGKMSM